MMTMDCRYDCKVSNKMQNKYLKIVKMICFLENLDQSAAHRDRFSDLRPHTVSKQLKSQLKREWSCINLLRESSPKDFICLMTFSRGFS